MLPLVQFLGIAGFLYVWALISSVGFLLLLFAFLFENWTFSYHNVATLEIILSPSQGYLLLLVVIAAVCSATFLN